MALNPSDSQTFSYSPLSRLNTVQVWHNDSDVSERPRFWVLFIHGGGWRDPDIDASSIQPSLSHLSPVLPCIKGIASLDYRLSPYSNHSTNPSGDDPARNAKHPDHIEDIMTALCWLQYKYGFGQQYILVGHSAGATLAFQSITGHWSPRDSTPEYPLSKFVPPVATAGVAGIYDIPALIESFSSIPIYREFVNGAFGSDLDDWKTASPVNTDVESSWTNAKLAIIAYSEEDELIDTIQSNKMLDHLSKLNLHSRRDIQLRLRGDHDGIWKEGSELANVIIHSINHLIESAESKP